MPIRCQTRRDTLSLLFAAAGMAVILSAPTQARVAPDDAASDRAGAVLERSFIYTSAPYPQAHASTIAQTADGTLAAAWFGGSHEGAKDVSIYFARRTGGAWDTPVKLADGRQTDGNRYPTWNPVLFQPDDGPLMLFYKVGPNPRRWWGMVRTSRDGGRHWDAARRLPDGILGPIKNKAVSLADGSWLSPSSTERAGNDWTIHFERSTDHGASWQATPPVASPEHLEAIQPSVLFHEDGRLEALARTRQGVIAMTWSDDHGRSWSPLAAIDLPNPNSGIDAVTLADGRQLLVYNHSAHLPDSPGKGVRYPIDIALSRDGVHWQRVLTLERKPLPDGYAYPAVIQSEDGLVHITYTYDRRRIRYIVVDPERLPDMP